MFFKRIFGAISVAILCLAIFAFFPSTSLHISSLESGPVSPLTGVAGEAGPVLVVKLDDTTFAHPQVGLRSADLVYIEQVEGGLTRLAAVFSSKIPSLVGPVRSARISDIELLSQYGKIGFAFSGAQRLLLPEIAKANLFDVGANKFGPKFYSNDPARITPYAMMLKAPDLMTEAVAREMHFAHASPMGWTFGDAAPTLKKIESAHISWPASSYDVTWSVDEDRWLLTHNGKQDVDDTGYVLGPSTFVVQIVSITDSIFHDKVGGVTPFSATVGEGSCYLLRDGGYIPCTWRRNTPESGTTFYDLNGSEISFARGQIWFALTAKEPAFTLQDATTSATK